MSYTPSFFSPRRLGLVGKQAVKDPALGFLVVARTVSQLLRGRRWENSA